MKQTAVEWLVKEYSRFVDDSNVPFGVIKQAKEMEKEQIEDAYEKGYTEDIPYPVSGGYYKMNAEQYYNETFGKEEIIVTEYKDGTIQVETYGRVNNNCVFEPTTNTTSATICKWCGQEKFLHKN